MSEFAKEDCMRWLNLAWEKHCSIHDAIYYDLYWSCRTDTLKAQRGFEFFAREMGLNTPANTAES